MSIQATASRASLSSPSRVAAVRSQTLLVLVVALVLRLCDLYIVTTRFPVKWLYGRGIEMGLLAASLLRGEGLSSPFGPPTGPTAFIAPGYPLLTAAIFRLFGMYSRASSVVIISLQIAAGLLTVWLVMHLARALFHQRAAVVAGLIWSCSLPLVMVPTIFWDTAFAIALVTGMAALVLRLRTRCSPVQWVFLGAYCALAGLINPALLLVLGAMVLWLAWQHRTSRVLWAAVAFALLFSPWPIRNARVFHAFIPLRTTVGFELWMGNRPGASGFLDEDQFPMYNPAELADYIRRGELGYTRHKSDLAREFILEHPQTFLRMTAMRVLRFWTGTGSKGGSAVFGCYATFTSLVGFAGLWLLFRRRATSTAVLFTLPLLLFPLPYYITHAEFRYRLVIDPLLTVLASGALAALYRRVRQGHTSRAAALVAETANAA